MAVVNSVYEERFRSSFKTLNGRIFYVSIWDRKWTYSGASMGTPPYHFQISDNGLNIQFDCDGDEKFAPIVGSKCTLNFMVDLKDTSEFHGEFIDDLLGVGSNSPYTEGDLFIEVREGSSTGAHIFFGEYLMDLDTLPDVDSPFPIQLTFTDGIGKLKEIPFQYSNVFTDSNEYKYMGHQKFPYWIGQVMQHTKMYKNDANPNGFWDNATNKWCFDTCVRWYNSYMYYNPDDNGPSTGVLDMTKGTMKWADKYNSSDQQRVIANAYDVLKAICKSWGMRVVCWQGVWRFRQIREMDNDGSSGSWFTPQDQWTRRYKGDGEPTGTDPVKQSMGIGKWDRFRLKFQNVTFPGQRIQKLQGSSYKFLPTLKEVKVNLVHEGFQNIFGGIPTGNYLGTNYIPFSGGPFMNSTQYKFKTSFFIQITAPTNVNVQSFWFVQVNLRIIATNTGLTGGTMSSICLATLSYDPALNSYGWDDTPTYTLADLGPVITHYSSASLAAPGNGATSVIELWPKLEFPGYQDSSTYYIITNDSPIFAANQNNVGINIQTGFPFGSSAIFTGWGNPVNTTIPVPPSWSTGFFNNFLSTIEPVSTTSTATMNTIFVNTQTADSHELDWGEVFWGDGPEHWDDSALLIQSGASTWVFADWTSKDWKRMNYTETSNPVADTGYLFTELLTYQMKQCQATTLRRASFRAAQMDDYYGGQPFFMNPVGTIWDCDENSDGTPKETIYFFRRGNYNMMMNEWDGEWIEAQIGTASSNTISVMGGSSNLQGPGGGIGNLVSSTGGNPPAMAILLQGTANVTKDVAITSLNTVVMDQTPLGNTFVLGTDYDLKSGDELYMVYPSGITYKITLTADVATTDESISFSSITPTESSEAPPTIQIPLIDIYEQSQRKTKGTIAGMTVTSTTIDGAASIGREQISFRGEGSSITANTYYVLNGEDNNKSGRFGLENDEAPSNIDSQISLKGGIFYCDSKYRIESGSVAISATTSSVLTVALYKATPVDNTSGNIAMTSIGTASITGAGNSKPRIASFGSLLGTDINAGDMIIPHVITSEAVESTNFRGSITFTLIRKS